MTTQAAPICNEHRIEKFWRPTTFEYAEDGIVVRVPNIHAWVCKADEASFTPEVTDELITTVRELIGSAKRARERKSGLTEYFVSVR